MGAFIASAISLHHTLENLPDSNDADPAINRIDDIVDFGYNSLLFNARAASATGIAVSLVTILYEILPIVLRFLNIGFINYKIKIFLGIVSTEVTLAPFTRGFQLASGCNPDSNPPR